MSKMSKMSKNCGNCVHFTRIKNWWTGGLCEHFDVTTKPENGKSCQKFKGKRYERPKNKKDLNDEAERASL